VVARPTDVATVMELARQSTLQGKRTEAAGMYEALLDRDPANVRALREAAKLYDKLEQPLRSMYCWQRLLKLHPDDLNAKERLAAIYKAIGSDDEAIGMYEGMGHAQAWRNIAFLRLKRAEELRSEQGKREEAERERKLAMVAYQKIIEMEKRDVQARLALGALLQQSDRRTDRERALKLYKEVLEVDGENRRARLNLANLYCRTNRLAQAQDEYDALLDQQPNLAAAQLGLGVVYRKLGEYRKAVVEYRKALNANPNSPQVHYNTAVLYDFYMDKPDLARFHYDRFRELGGDPDCIPKPAPVPAPDAADDAAVGQNVPPPPKDRAAKRDAPPAEAVPLQVEPVQSE
jgi:tetratricopeptide (TPR) repeat protein